MRTMLGVVFGCLAIPCWAQVTTINSTNAPPAGLTSGGGVAWGSLTNTSQIRTTADLIALTNAITGKTNLAPVAVAPPIQYLTPEEWAAVTNGMSPSDLADLAALAPQAGALSAAALGAIKAGLTTNDVSAIAATAAQVLASQAQSAGSIQPMTSGSSMTGSTLVSGHILNINFGNYTNSEVGPAAVGVGPNDFWTGLYYPYGNIPTITNLLWSDQTNSGISLSVANAAGCWGNGLSYDQMADTYIYSGSDITVTLTGVPSGTYSLYLYGHGPTTDNSVFSVTSPANNLGTNFTSTTTSWQSTTWTLGAQYVLFPGLIVTNGQVTVDVHVDSIGYALVAGLQLVPTSSGGGGSPSTLINMDFITTETTGAAAAPASGSYYWNYLSYSPPVPVANLLLSDGTTPSGASVTPYNFPGAWAHTSTDPMLFGYVYAPYGQSGTMTVSNLQAGLYCVYAYSFDGNFTLTVGTSNYATLYTTYNISNGVVAVNAPPWLSGIQYASWTNVTVAAGQPMVLTVNPGIAGYAALNGMQVASQSGPPPAPPTITTQPQSEIVCAGNAASYTVVAAGAGPLSYQWTFNTVNISGATSSAYTIASAQTSQQGSYAVIVSNSGGSVQSSGATLTVNTAPAITTQPQSQTVYQGANATFSVGVTGTAPFTYQWRRGGVSLSGATLNAYTIYNVQPSDAANYDVIVQNTCGSVQSSAATLAVTATAFTNLLNLDFGGAAASGKTGLATTGQTNSDHWNYLGPQVPGPLFNLINADLSVSPIGVTANNLTVAGTDGSTDPMYSNYITTAQSGQSGTLTLNNLATGSYDVYAYSYDGNFSLSSIGSGGTNFGSATTSYNKPLVNPPPWVPSLHYAAWKAVALTYGQGLVLTVSPGAHDNLAVICGLQIAMLDTNGMEICWEMQNFGHTGVDPNADYDRACPRGWRSLSLLAPRGLGA